MTLREARERRRMAHKYRTRMVHMLWMAGVAGLGLTIGHSLIFLVTGVWL